MVNGEERRVGRRRRIYKGVGDVDIPFYAWSLKQGKLGTGD